MPTYAYACRDCGSKLEVHQAFADPSLTVCPTCGGTLRKQYGTVGVTFNGSGFYRTDSRTKESGGADSSGGDGGTASSGGDSGSSKGAAEGAAPAHKEAAKPSTDAKPAAKPAATPAS